MRTLRAVVWSACIIVLGLAVPARPQLSLGLTTDASWGTDGWLGALVAHAWWTVAGYGGLVAAAGLFAVLGLGAIELLARRRGAGDRGVLLAFALTALCAFATLHVGRGIAGWSLAAWYLVALAERGRRWPIIATALAVVWYGLSPAGALAPVLALAVAAGECLGARRVNARAARMFAIAGATALGITALSGGAHWLFALGQTLDVSSSFGSLHERTPQYVAHVAYTFGFVPLVLLTATVGLRRIVDAPLAVGAIIIAQSDARFLPLAGIVAAPLLAAQVFRAIGAQTDEFSWSNLWRRRACAAGLTPVAAALAIIAFESSRSIPTDPTVPVVLVEHLTADPRPHRVACIPLEWCDLVVAAQLPGLVPLLSERTIQSNAVASAAQLAIQRVQAGWSERLDRERIDVVLVGRGRTLATLLDLDPAWTLRERDHDALLFTRSPAPVAARR